MVLEQLVVAQNRQKQAARAIIELGGLRPWTQDHESVSETLDRLYVGTPQLSSK